MKELLPLGVRDFLPQEIAEREVLLVQIRQVFDQYGYQLVETPEIAYFDAIAPVLGPHICEKGIRFFDPYGQLLVLRPDYTASIARLVAMRMTDRPFPIKLCYMDTVFRKDHHHQESVFFQAGVEFIGLSSVETDAAVIMCCIESLLKIGIKDFGIDIGHQSFIEKLSKTEKDALMRGDFVTFGSIPQRGGVEIVGDHDYCFQLYTILRNNNMASYITFNKGLIKDFQYYSGVIFDCYVNGVGTVIGSGGRYDTLLEKLGFKCPAVGFALDVDRLIEFKKND